MTKDASFTDWVDHCFNHEVGGPQWYFDVDAPYVELSPRLAADYLTRLFGDPSPSLTRFSNEQLNQGLWYVINPGGGDYMVDAMSDVVVLADRIRCIEAMFPFFETIFATRCSAHLSYNDEAGADPLNLICYMWWDLLPIVPKPSEAGRQPIDAAALGIMQRTLTLPHIACQENALHGLGHWVSDYPDDARRIIDGFLAGAGAMRPELRQYAENAKIGYVN